MRKIKFEYHKYMAWVFIYAAKLTRPVSDNKIGDRVWRHLVCKGIKHIQAELKMLKT